MTATVIPLTSVTSRAASTRPTKEAAPAPFRIVQVASLSRVKNQRLLIDAFRMVREKIDAHLDLVGEDTLHGALQAHATKIGIDTRVTFHGFLPQERVLEILSHADLYVQSSLHEAAGVSVLEAAAAGVPVVGTPAGYVADWSPTKAAALDDATPEYFAEVILFMHADPDWRRWMAGHARKFVDRARRRLGRRAIRSVVSRSTGHTPLDRAGQRQVQAAHASTARLVAIDVE